MQQTLRKSMQEILADFVTAAGFENTSTIGLIADLVFKLGAYREEDRVLFPEVYVLERRSLLTQLVCGYFERMLGEIVRQSHGCLIGVIPSDVDELHKSLTDGVVLTPPIDFVSPTIEAQDAVKFDLSALLSLEALLAGMICSDGITILGSNATARGFRIFIQAEAHELDGLSVSGGARSRAFELMMKRLGTVFQAVFFRSQDGKTKFAQVEQ